MKKFLFSFAAAAALVLTGCANVDLSPLEQRLNDIEGRIKAIEAKVTELNTNASGLKTAVEALEKEVTVASVEKLSDGYKIIFSDKTEAVIKNGAAGGQGPQGPEGPAGSAPTIGVKDVDGVLVWTVNDEPVKDGQGKVIPVTATSAAPEFKCEGDTWYYRIGQGEWVACGAGSGSSDCYIVELADAYMIVMGEDTLVLPKENVAAPIESIALKLPRVFLPADKTLDLTEWFDVTPAGAVKSAVKYVYATDAPIAIDLAGKVTANGNTGSIAVNIVARNDENITATIYVRTGPVVGDEPATSAPADAKYLFKDSYADFTGLRAVGGAATWNPFNGAIAALPGGGVSGHNIYFRPQPVNSGLTKENGHLYFKWYIKDVTKLVPGSGQIELTSSDNPDAKEMNWSTSFIANCQNGWNEVDLAFADANDIASDFDPNGINWFRFFNETTIGSEDPLEVAMVKDVCVYAVAPIESITANIAKIFVPVGKTLDLTEWFDVAPVNASKTAVQYTFDEGSFTIDADGKLTATGIGSKTVTIVSKADENVKAAITVRTGPVVGDEPATSAPADAKYLFKDSLEEINSFAGMGGAATWNPFNGALAAMVGGGASGHNLYFKPQPINSGLTKENGHLYFKWYISDVTKLVSGSGQLELTSSANPDAQEMNWSTSFIANCHNGWNEIDLAFADAADIAAEFNPNGINWFRFFNETTVGSEDPYEVAMIKDVCVYKMETVSLPVGYSGGNVSTGINASEVVIPAADQSWISSSIEGGQAVLTVASNPWKERSSIITVVNGSVSRAVEVKQESRVLIDATIEAPANPRNTQVVFNKALTRAYFITRGARRLYEINLAEAKMGWMFDMNGDGVKNDNGGCITVNPITGDIIVSNQKNIFCVKPDGTQKWAKTVSGVNSASSIPGGGAAISNDGSVVFVPCLDHYVYALSMADGSEKAKFDCGGAPNNIHLAVLGDDLLFVKWQGQNSLLMSFDGDKFTQLSSVDHKVGLPDLMPPSISRDQRFIATARGDGFLDVFEFNKTAKTLRHAACPKLVSDGGNVWSSFYLPSGKVVATSEKGSAFYVTDTPDMIKNETTGTKVNTGMENGKLNFQAPGADADGYLVYYDPVALAIKRVNSSGSQAPQVIVQFDTFTASGEVQGVFNFGGDYLVMGGGTSSIGARIIVAKADVARAKGWSGHGGDPCRSNNANLVWAE